MNEEEPKLGDLVIGYRVWKDGTPEGLPMIGRYDGKLMSGHYELDLGDFDNPSERYRCEVVDIIEPLGVEVTDIIKKLYGERR